MFNLPPFLLSLLFSLLQCLLVSLSALLNSPRNLLTDHLNKTPPWLSARLSTHSLNFLLSSADFRPLHPTAFHHLLVAFPVFTSPLSRTLTKIFVSSSPSMSLTRAARLILVGAPGAGKGTQTERLMKRFPELSSISSGDLLRKNVREKTPLGTENLWELLDQIS